MGSVIDNLQNVVAPTLNESVYNDSSNLIVNIITNANTSTGSLWFVWSILALWIFLIYFFMSRDEQILLDLPRSLLVSSGWCLIISIGAGLFNLTTNIFPILWFASIFFLSGLMVYRRAEVNR